MRTAIAGFLTLLSVPALSAQTFVVDANNGPGTNFTDLPQAVAAVPDGAVLVVRPGSYTGFSLSGKGISILGQLGSVISGQVLITNTAPQQAVTIRQLRWSTAYLATWRTWFLLELTGCAGPVLLENVAMPANQQCLPYLGATSCIRSVGVAASQCVALTMRNCDVRCTVELTGTSAVLESTRVEGESSPGSSYFNNFGRTAITLNGGNTQIAGASYIRGGDGVFAGVTAPPPGDGIRNIGGGLRILDGMVIAGSSLWPIQYAVNGPARIAPRVTLSGTAGPLVGTDIMPVLVGSDAPPGGSLRASVTTEIGDLVVLVVGLPGPPAFFSGIADAFWIDPSNHFFAAIGFQQTTPISVRIAVPASPAFLAARLNWQAACRGPLTGFQATNPVVTIVR